jgi:hypothetical protein
MIQDSILVCSPDLRIPHTAQRGPPTPIDRPPVIVVQSCRVRNIGEIQVAHNVANHLDSFGALIHGIYLGLAQAPRGFGFPRSSPGNWSAAPNEQVPQERADRFFIDIDRVTGGRMGGVLQSPVCFRVGHALGGARGLLDPVSEGISKAPFLGEADTAMFGAFQIF